MDKIIIANWKMKPASPETAERLARASDSENVVVAPPFLFVERVRHLLTKASVGSQDVFYEDPQGGGAYTGEVSCAMLKAVGVTHVIVGHSERRQYLQESDEMIAKKAVTAARAGIVPVLCVGESREVRDAGSDRARAFVEAQLMKDLSLFNNVSANIIIAYEPVWAIGTGREATPSEISDMISAIRKIIETNFSGLRVQVLYGGSVNGENIAGIAREKNVDGFLVGGASVDEKEFPELIRIVREL